MMNFLFALSTLVGTIIGVGIFGIPYVITKSGLLPGLFYLLVLGIAVLILHLAFGEIVLRTEGKHRAVGYAEIYLGKQAKTLVAISTIIGIIGSLLAYLIVAGDFLKIIFSSLFLTADGSPAGEPSSFYFSLIFWLVLAYFIFRGIKLVAPVELLLNILFFAIIFIIFLFALPKLNFQNFSLIEPTNIFLPYGVILFALAGGAAIPELTDIFKTPQERKSLKKVIILASLITVLLYFVFALAVIGVSGSKTTPEALSGLVSHFGQKIIILGVVFGLLAIISSVLILGLYLKNTFIYDYRLSPNLASALVFSLPLILFLLGFRQFIETAGFTGAIIGAIDGTIILLIFQKAKKFGKREPEYSLKIPKILLYFLIAIFIFGAISYIVG